MRILIFTGSEFDSSKEIQRIAEKHSVYPVSEGEITHQRIYDIAAAHKCNVMHFALHSGESGIQLPDNSIFTPDDVARVAKMSGAYIVVINSCESAATAIVIAFKGIPFIFYGTGKTLNEEAIKFATALYSALPEDISNSLQVLEAYADTAYDGDGRFGYVVSPALLRKLLLIETKTKLPEWQWIMIVGFGVINIAMSVIAILN